MKLYKLFGIILAIVFAIVGLLFAFVPDGVISIFNFFSPPLGLPQAPLVDHNFFLILCVGYMYLVSVVAFMMFRQPANSTLPLLLAHAKSASSVISILFFILHAHYLIYIVNFVIDGSIGMIAVILYLKLRGKSN
ncbi:MAG TPA: hypothetical protein VIS48_12805 [Candidatus Kryptonia bacterium]